MTKKQLPKGYMYGFLALVLANLIWAAATPIIKLTVETIPPFTFLFLRFLIVCLILFPFTAIQLTKHKIYPGDYWKILVLGLFAQSSIILVVLGLQYTTSIDSSIISILGTLITMAAGHYFFNEKMHTGLKIGIFIASAGTAFVMLEPVLMGDVVGGIPPLLRLWGNVLVLLYNLAFLLYIIWSKISFGESTKIIKKVLHFVHIKPMKFRYSASLLTALSFYIGMISMLPLAIMENFGVFGPIDFDASKIGTSAILGILYMAILSSICAYFLFEWSLTKVSVSETAILGYVSAIFTLPFSYLLLNELPTKWNLIGSVVIAIGVVIAEISAHHIRKKKHFII